MQDGKDLYEYAVIRLVPKVEREEFINVGLVLFCKQKRWLKMDYHLNTEKLAALAPSLDCNFITHNLRAFQEIAEGTSANSPIASYDTAERFRWLTAVRSSIIQTSRPHPGMSNDLEKTFKQLFDELVH